MDQVRVRPYVGSAPVQWTEIIPFHIPDAMEFTMHSSIHLFIHSSHIMAPCFEIDLSLICSCLVIVLSPCLFPFPNRSFTLSVCFHIVTNILPCLFPFRNISHLVCSHFLIDLSLCSHFVIDILPCLFQFPSRSLTLSIFPLPNRSSLTLSSPIT